MLTQDKRPLLIDDPAHPFFVRWDAFKLSQPVETDHGDIAVLVRQRFSRGATLDGVGFIEAKRSYKEHDERYHELHSAQLKRHIENSHNHRLLLYTEVATNSHIRNLQLQGMCGRCSHAYSQDSHAVLLASQHYLAISSQAPADLHSLSLPLSYQLCARYLAGFDLDFSKTAVAAAKSNVRGGARYLFVAHVGQDIDREPEPMEDELNGAGFRRLTDTESNPEPRHQDPDEEPPMTIG